MSSLPEAWCETTVGAVTAPYDSVDPSSQPDRVFRYIDIGSIDNTIQEIAEPKAFTGAEAPSRARRVVKTGDTLFSTVRTYLKNVALVPSHLDGELTSTGIAVLRPSGAILPEYLFAVARSQSFADHVSVAQDGTMYPAVSDADVMAAPIPLPPKPEQRRIVGKIDSLSAKSKRARDRLNHVPRLVERYKAALLDLSYEIAQAENNALVPLGEIAVEVKNGLSKKPAESPPGLPILRISAVRPGRVIMTARRYYPEDGSFDPKAVCLRQGDLLFTRYNGNPDFVAVCGMVGDVGETVLYPDKLIRVRVLETAVLPSFVEAVVNSRRFRASIQSAIKTAAGQHGISGSDLKRAQIPLPSLPRQQRIVRSVKSALTWIDRLAAEATSARKLIDRLDQAVLAKAFRGELVPQDPDDEPASVLLERIKTARSGKSVAGRRRRGPND